MDNIQKQQEAMRERSTVFETVPFSEGFFTAANRVNCAAPFSEYSSARLLGVKIQRLMHGSQTKDGKLHTGQMMVFISLTSERVGENLSKSLPSSR